jgi:hypothetical protein
MRRFGLLLAKVAWMVPVWCGALEIEPWFSDVYEFHWTGSWVYSRFSSVQAGCPQIVSPFNANLIYTDLEFCPSPQWCADCDVQLADTAQMAFNFRSAAVQARYLLLDDIVGDPISFLVGGGVRFTSSAALHDVSCPSHANADFEISAALGREFDCSEVWRWRLWCHAALGQANAGSPWVRAVACVQTNIDEKHKWDFFAMAMNGYGRHSHVDTEHFNGYAKIRQKSIDIGLRYGHRLGMWGVLRLEYAHRVLSKACPQNLNTFGISYLLSFSF